jgi:hypothetical protein
MLYGFMGMQLQLLNDKLECFSPTKPAWYDIFQKAIIYFNEAPYDTQI